MRRGVEDAPGRLWSCSLTFFRAAHVHRDAELLYPPPRTLACVDTLLHRGTLGRLRSRCPCPLRLTAQRHRGVFPEWHEVGSDSLQPLQIGYFH